MEKEAILWVLDTLKIYISQKKEFRTKFKELLEEMDKEVDKKDLT